MSKRLAVQGIGYIVSQHSSRKVDVSMGQSLVQIYIHLVFSTKHREPFLRNSSGRERLYGYMAGGCQNQNCPAIIIGGFEDHVHLLFRLGKNVELANLVRELKKESSEWVKRELAMEHFYWQTGYGAFSISAGHVEVTREYIANQEEHHRQVSFQDEFRRICAKNSVPIDESYVWD